MDANTDTANSRAPQGRPPQQADGRESRHADRDGTEPAPPAGEEQRQYLTFAIGGEPFAIGILYVKEILEFADVAPVPMVPGFIRGVINLRGRVVPVVDLGSRFGRSRTPETKRTCIIIIELKGDSALEELGVMVDAVHSILEIPEGEIEPPPAFGAKIRTDFIQGMGKVNGKFMIILNLDSVFSTEEMAQLMARVGQVTA